VNLEYAQALNMEIFCVSVVIRMGFGDSQSCGREWKPNDLSRAQRGNSHSRQTNPDCRRLDLTTVNWQVAR
jgi:hypothetical protein